MTSTFLLWIVLIHKFVIYTLFKRLCHLLPPSVEQIVETMSAQWSSLARLTIKEILNQKSNGEKYAELIGDLQHLVSLQPLFNFCQLSCSRKWGKAAIKSIPVSINPLHIFLTSCPKKKTNSTLHLHPNMIPLLLKRLHVINTVQDRKDSKDV